MSGARNLERVDLAEETTLAGLQEKIRSFAEANPKSPWIVGRGWVFGSLGLGERNHRARPEDGRADRGAEGSRGQPRRGVVSAAALVSAGARSVFCATRPPGHHAGADFMGGYCFLNNAAIAARALGVHAVDVLEGFEES